MCDTFTCTFTPDETDYIDAAMLLWSEFKSTFSFCFGYGTAMELLRAQLRHCPLLVARGHDGDLIGACNLVDDDLGPPWNALRPEYTPWLANIVVAPKYRGQGYGTCILNTVLDRHRGHTLYLWTWSRDLCNWYTRHGFQHVESIAGHCGHDEIFVMRINS